MNYQPMDFVLQVTVVELVLGKMDDGRVLSFELSRGSKVRVKFWGYRGSKVVPLVFLIIHFPTWEHPMS